jgi:hypothetical protein
MAGPNDKLKALMKQSLRKLDKLAGSHSGNKMSAKGQYYNGSYYHSTGERDHAMMLDLRLKAKDIKEWKRQVKIELRVNGQFIASYYMDFLITHNDGTIELVEYKGMRTPLFEMKWSLLHALKDELYPNGVTITMVKHKSKYNPWKQPKK